VIVPKARVDALPRNKIPDFAVFLRAMDFLPKNKNRKGEYNWKKIMPLVVEKLQKLGVTDPSKLIASVKRNLDTGHTLTQIADFVESKKK